MAFKQHMRAAGSGLILWAAAATSAFGQSALPPQTTDDALRALTDAAGIVFTGTVTAVRRPASSAGVVEVDFAVSDAIRGVSGSEYTLREWAGLWEASDEPFRPGQRYLMLLHTPNSAGLTSPVGGPDGAIPIRPATSEAPATQSAATSYDAVTATLADAGQQTVDLGWISTRVAAPVVYRPPTPARPIMASGVQTDSAASNANSAAAPLPAPDRLRAAQYTSVVNMLRNGGTLNAR